MLEVFIAGNREHYLYQYAEAYARWGAQRVVNGESKPFPIKTGKPGKADSFDALRVALELTDEHRILWCVTVHGHRVRFGPGESMPPGDAQELTQSSRIAQLLSGCIESDGRTAVSLIHEAIETAFSFGGLVLTPFILMRRPYTRK
ncbi:MAG: hypothetical protein WBG92_24860 [Thiohalocapsa sp.]